MTFVPSPFTTPVVASRATTLGRLVPYISVSEYQAAPTAVKTSTLIPGGNAQQQLAQLAQVILRASSWVDDYCFHGKQGTLAASVTTESDFFHVKPNGTVSLICNVKPVLAVVGVATGPTPSTVADISPTAAPDIAILSDTVLELPGYWSSAQPQPFLGRWASNNGQLYVVWSYIAGFPHVQLAETATAGATSITVTPTDPAATVPAGIYEGTQLAIRDAVAGEETVVVAATPTSNVLTLLEPTQLTHTVPAAPDAIWVSSLPWAVEQAAISVTSVLIKTQGVRAFVLPMTSGTASERKSMGLAGALDDFDYARKLLKPYRTSFLRA